VIDIATPPANRDDPLLPRVPLRPEAEPPVVIYSGCVSLWLGLRVFVVAAFVLVLGLACIGYGLLKLAPPYRTGLMVVGAALCFSCGLMLLKVLIRIRSRRYKIDTRLIEREQGVFMKRVDSIDLARVKDVELSQSLLQRTLHIGTIVVFSSDRVNPLMVIEAVPHPRFIYEKLRDAVIAVAQKRGVIPMN
jgi:membrane protein YdbS with pleckstrin-like domain